MATRSTQSRGSQSSPAVAHDTHATAAPTGGVGGESGEQEAARLAHALLTQAIEVLESVMAKPTRGSASQLGAARLVFELTAKLAPAAVAAESRPAKLVLVDAKDAAEELARRLGTR